MGDRGTQTLGGILGGILTIRSEARTPGKLLERELAGAVKVAVADAITIANLSSEGVRESGISRSRCTRHTRRDGRDNWALRGPRSTGLA